MDQIKTKKCLKCKEEKAHTEFYIEQRNRDGRVSSCRTCMRKTRHAYYLRTKEASAEYSRDWMQKNPTQYQVIKARYRAGRENAKPRWLTHIQEAQIAEHYEVALARTVQTGIEHQVDHIFPLRHPLFGGLHVPWNLQVIPATVNNVKRCRVPADLSHLLADGILTYDARTGGAVEGDKTDG